MKVACLYRFKASHSLPGVAGYDQPHEHDYTVEVVVDGGPWKKNEGMVVDTQALDDEWETMRGWLDGQDLNMVFRGMTTTVENLARRFRFTLAKAVPARLTVTVWEDDDRWGQAP